MVSGSSSLAPVPAREGAEMFVNEMRRAIAPAPREMCAKLVGAVWAVYAASAIGDVDAKALAEALEARKTVPAPTSAPRHVGRAVRGRRRARSDGADGSHPV